MRLNVETFLPKKLVYRAQQKKRLSLGLAWFSLFLLTFSLPFQNFWLVPSIWFALAVPILLLYPEISRIDSLRTVNASQTLFVFITLNLGGTLFLFANESIDCVFIASITGGFLFFCTRNFRLQIWQTNIHETHLSHMHNAILNYALKNDMHLRQGSTRIDSSHASAYELDIYVVSERNKKLTLEWNDLEPWLTFFPEWDIVRSPHKKHMVDILNMLHSDINLPTTRRNPFDTQNFKMTSHEAMKRLAPQTS